MPSPWSTRSQAPDVFLAMRLDDVSALNLSAVPDPHYAPFGVAADAWNGQPNPYIDTGEAPAGAAGSLAFEFRQLTGGSPGQWFSNCSHDNSLKFNEGDTFFIQFRVKYSTTLDDEPILVNDGRGSQTLLNNPFYTLNGSQLVTVNWPGHPVAVGENVFFSHADPVAGINMNRAFPVTAVYDVNNFVVTASVAANASVNGGGGQVAVFATVNGLGEPWRVGTLGANPFTTTSGSNVVTVHHVGHNRLPTHGVMFANAVAVGGLDMNRAFGIHTVIDADNYTVQHSGVAASSGMGGGSTVDRLYLSVSTGLKIFDIVARDVLVTDPGSGQLTSAPGYAPGQMNVTSSDMSKVVTTWGDPICRVNPYHYYFEPGRSDSGLYESIGGGSVRYLTEQASCTSLNNSNVWRDSGGCQGLVTGEWLTFQLQVTLGTATTTLVGDAIRPVWLNSELKWWFAREGQPQQLLHWWRPGLAGYEHLLRYTDPNTNPDTTGDVTDFFKVNLFPFWNDKLYVQPHDTIKVNYGELIGSTSFIDDPLDAAVSGVGAALGITEEPDTLQADVTARVRVAGDSVAAAASITVTAGNGLPAFVPAPGFVANIELNTMRTVNPCPGDNCIYSPVEGQGAIFDWCGGAYMTPTPAWPYGALLMHGGGHNGYYGDECYNFDFATRTWSRTFPGGAVSTPSLVGPANPTPDAFGETSPGVPASTHTAQHLKPLYPQHGGGTNGSTLLVHISTAGTESLSSPYGHRFDHATATWERYPSQAKSLVSAPTLKVAYDTTRGIHWMWKAGNPVVKLHHLPTPSWETVVVPNNANFIDWWPVGVYVPTLDILVCLNVEASTPHEVWYLSCANPSVGWTQVFPMGFTGATIYNSPSICWSESLGVIGVYDPGVNYPEAFDMAHTGNDFIRYLRPPDSLGGAWTWSTESFSPVPGNPTPGIFRGEKVREVYDRMQWVEALKCWAWWDSTRGPVQLLRPIGT